MRNTDAGAHDGHLKRDAGAKAIAKTARLMLRTGPLISQDGGAPDNRAFDFCGIAGFIISLVITINRPRFAISRFSLELPWEGYVWWLDDPFERDGRSYVYRFYRNYIPQYERGQVLNHLADVRRMWPRGHSLKGYLLGVGNGPIPDQYRQGEIIPASLIVYDQFGHDWRSPISLWTDRTARLFQPTRSEHSPKDGFGTAVI